MSKTDSKLISFTFYYKTKGLSMSNTKIKVEATISAKVEKVWEYFNSPNHNINWAFASDDWHCPKSEIDFRVGGKICNTMAAKDGSFSFDFEGIYDEIIINQKVVYTLTDQRKVENIFENNGNQTKLTVTFDAEESNPVEFQKNGWQAILDNFKKYVENN